MSSQKIAELVFVLCEAFRQKATEFTARAYEIGLRGMSDEDINRAVNRAISECKFMPTVAELRELSGVAKPEDLAMLAWHSVKEAIRDVGEYKSVDFSDRAINGAIRIMGGWERLCGMPGGDEFDTWTRKRFEEIYKSLSRHGVSEELAAPLAGYFDRTNSASGFLSHVKPPVLIECDWSPVQTRIEQDRRVATICEASFGIGAMPIDCKQE